MSTAEKVLATLREQVSLVSPEINPESVGPGISLEQLGCSSIDRAEITVLTMEALNVTLSPMELNGVHDVASLVNALAAKL